MNEDKKEYTSFVDTIIARIEDAEVATVRRAAPEAFPGEHEFRENSLIMSGVALGAEHAARYAMQAKAEYLDIVKANLVSINRQIAMHLDNPERMEFLHALRKPILEAFRLHVDQLISAAADDAYRVYGISPKIVLARDPTPEFLATVPDTASAMQTTEYLGFLLTEPGVVVTNTATLCTMYHMSGRTMADVIRSGVERYGSAASASNAFTSHVLVRTWARMDEIEAELGLDKTDEIDIIGEPTEEVLQYLSAGVPLPRAE